MSSAGLLWVRRGSRRQGAVTVAALGAAMIVGAAVAVDPRIGVALLLALCAVPLVLLSPPLGVALWAALTPLADLPGMGLAYNAVGLLAVITWLGVLGRDRVGLREGLAHRRGATAIVLLLAWVTLSLAWAEDPGRAAAELWRWYAGGLVVAVVVTILRRPRDLRLVIGAFVAGVVLSVLIGLVRDGLGGGNPAVETVTSTEGRLKGGLGDPNILAAAIVPATVLAGTLMSSARSAMRWSLAIGIGVLVVGLGATQSRGGALAAAAALVAALLLMPRHRKRVAMVALGVVLVGAVYLAAYPAGLSRFSSADEGNGRTEIWRVAVRIADRYPVAGVGLHNFTVYSPRYVDRPGALKFADLIAERPHVVHNTYLEALTETGVVGLGLFLAVVIACLDAACSAARRFERRAEDALATLSRGVLVATVGMLAAAVFVSIGSSPVLWLLLALGPALLAYARSDRGDSAEASARMASMRSR
jgi:O-antigen ligase